MNRLARLSLHGRFRLLVLLGVVLPLGLIGAWIAWSSQRSAVELIRTRLNENLNEGVQAFGAQWSRNLSTLIDLAESPAIQAILQGRDPASLDPAIRDSLQQRWRAAAEFTWAIEVRGLDGPVLAQLPDDLGEERSSRSPPPGFVNHDVQVRERFSGEARGTLAVQFRSDVLVAPLQRPTDISGSLMAMLDRRTGIALSPLPIDPAVLEQGAFEWGDDEWIAVVRDVVDPPIRFALAAPLGPTVTPLRSAARNGMIALVLVAAAAFWVTTLFSGRLTRSLESLSESARAIADGDLTARAPEEGPPAVRDTARAFNAMSAALRETLDTLSHREALAAVGEFAASLAHEVRNPLTSIRMDLERAQRKMSSEPGPSADLMERALREIDRLNTSVTNVLRIARSGKVAFAPVDLREPLEAAVQSAEPRFIDAGCRLRYDAESGPVWVEGDAAALEQLVLNLLLNAAEALAPGGDAGLRVERHEERVRVSVWDRGTGIAEADLERVFEPFFTTRRTGTGLGLSIARRMARAHGTDLTLDSTVGRGTTFTFELQAVTGSPERLVTTGPDEGHDPTR